MKIPFIKWGQTTEGTWTLLRLLTAVVILTVVLFLPQTHYVNKSFLTPIFLAGIFIMAKSVQLFLSQPEFKTMADGNAMPMFYQDSIYKYVRHPFYMGFWLIMLCITLVSVYWYTIALFILYTFLTWKATVEEEKRLLKLYQLDYYVYLDTTPKFIPWKLFKFIKAIFIL
jgi:protein-S-isoprenylcysteine O-methyltransferase Ste14